jgi:hypothetical protein
VTDPKAGLKETVFRLAAYPEALRKKVTLLEYFRNYLVRLFPPLDRAAAQAKSSISTKSGIRNDKCVFSVPYSSNILLAKKSHFPPPSTLLSSSVSLVTVTPSSAGAAAAGGPGEGREAPPGRFAGKRPGPSRRPAYPEVCVRSGCGVSVGRGVRVREEVGQDQVRRDVPTQQPVSALDGIVWSI